MATDLINRMMNAVGDVDRGAIDESERRLSLAAGAGLLVGTLGRGPLRRLLLTAAGGYLVYRGLAGRCPLCEQFAMRERPPRPLELGPPAADEAEPLRSHGELFEARHEWPRWEPPDDADRVDEASLESFPASDSPGYTGSSATPSCTGHEPRTT